jgi:sugar O-acyltransferase (sialic acid O-acetyltransferase NeuD family)
MKKALIGAGGSSIDIMAHMGDFDIIRFVDDVYWDINEKNILPLSKFNPIEYAVLITVGNSKDRANIVNRLPSNTVYFTYIHPSAILLGNGINIGHGVFISAGCILTDNIIIGNHVQLNINSSICHSSIIGDFSTLAPSVKISGDCKIGNRVYMGTNSATKEKVSITDDVIVGLNSGVVKSIYDPGTYIGTPAKLINK